MWIRTKPSSVSLLCLVRISLHQTLYIKKYCLVVSKLEVTSQKTHLYRHQHNYCKVSSKNKSRSEAHYRFYEGKNWCLFTVAFWEIVFCCYKFFQVWVTYFPSSWEQETGKQCWEKVVQVWGRRLRICDLSNTLFLLERTWKTSNKHWEKIWVFFEKMINKNILKLHNLNYNNA